jgi:hypothetical protein
MNKIFFITIGYISLINNVFADKAINKNDIIPDLE